MATQADLYNTEPAAAAAASALQVGAQHRRRRRRRRQSDAPEVDAPDGRVSPEVQPRLPPRSEKGRSESRNPDPGGTENVRLSAKGTELRKPRRRTATGTIGTLSLLVMGAGMVLVVVLMTLLVMLATPDDT